MDKSEPALLDGKRAECDDCGASFDRQAERGYYKKYPDGTVMATCPGCTSNANRIADAHADP